ncbi:CidA/LrgA family protein [Brachybacterium sp. YJGR34]|uniref:CidA/LrgA family protein n=1 Tax=Brachybacterium sp. YJGR34 TaxID=2059911 RepID=UPI000E0B3C5B|nr:CidA/LrgA family protein [Brachybacterium sp. YJGR34]
MSRLADLPPLLLGLVILVLAQLAGLGIAALLHLPVPGVVIGLVLLVIAGALRPTAVLTRLAEPAGAPLLKHLQLLFIPPGVGVVVELEELARSALPIALAVGGSFAITLVLAGRLLQALLRRQDRRRGTSGGGADGEAAA